MVLTTTAWNLVRLGTSILWLGAIDAYAPKPGPLYIGMTGAIWTATGLVVLWGLWRHKVWALRALLLASILYAAWLWVDRLCLQAQTQSNWPFTLGATAVLLGFTTAVALDPRVQAHFRKEAHERESEEPTTA